MDRNDLIELAELLDELLSHLVAQGRAYEGIRNACAITRGHVGHLIDQEHDLPAAHDCAAHGIVDERNNAETLWRCLRCGATWTRREPRR